MRLGTFAVRSRFVGASKAGEGDRVPPFGGTDEDLAALNSLSHRVSFARTRENVMIRAADVISDQPLKNGLVLRPEGVQAIVRGAFDTGVQANHDTGGMFGNGLSGLPLARCFRTRLVEDGGASWARMWFGFPRTSLNEELVERMDGGAIAELSASFYYREITCSICGGNFDDCAHRANEAYDGKTCLGFIEDPDEYVETSLVWQGMANDTRFRVAASRFDGEWKKPAPKGQEPDPLADLFGPLERDVVLELFMDAGGR